VVGAIPADWKVRTIGEEFEVSAGGDWDRPNSSKTQSHEFPFPIYANALTKNGIQGYCRYATVAGESLTITGRGDVGKAVFRAEPFVPIVRLLALAPKNGASARFYASYINSRLIFALESTGVPQLTAPQVRSYAIAVPPVAEQNSIAAALADIDDQGTILEQLIAKKETIKQGMMQQLLTGETRLPGFTEAWSTYRLVQLGVFLKGRGIKRDDVQASGVACIRYGELYTTYRTYTSATVSFVAPRVAATALPLRQGDLLFAGSGETREEIGMCVAFTGPQRAVAGGDIVVLRAPDVNPAYLAALANSPRVAAQKARLGQGDAVVHINSRELGSIEVDLPLRDEQDAIAQVLVDADSEIHALRSRLTKAKAIKQGMMQELLTGRTRLPIKETGAA
jgi:type I restriction enzyme S subunit